MLTARFSKVRQRAKKQSAEATQKAVQKHQESQGSIVIIIINGR